MQTTLSWDQNCLHILYLSKILQYSITGFLQAWLYICYSWAIARLRLGIVKPSLVRVRLRTARLPSGTADAQYRSAGQTHRSWNNEAYYRVRKVTRYQQGRPLSTKRPNKDIDFTAQWLALSSVSGSYEKLVKKYHLVHHI